MNLTTALTNLGINPSAVPKGFVGLLEKSVMAGISPNAAEWCKRRNNDVALAYNIDTEFKTSVGLILRNLHFGKDRAHLTVCYEKEEPTWALLQNSLPSFYESRKAVIVEGPKDALVLHTLGIPAAGYLGSSCSRGHLQVLSRYVEVVIWIPDNDPPSEQKLEREQQMHRICHNLGLRLIQYLLPPGIKDTGEFAEDPIQAIRLESFIERLVVNG